MLNFKKRGAIPRQNGLREGDGSTFSICYYLHVCFYFIENRRLYVRLDYFTLFHRVSSSHVKLLLSYLPISYPSFVVPTFEELLLYIPGEIYLVTFGSRTWIPSRSYGRMEAWAALYLLQQGFACVHFRFEF